MKKMMALLLALAMVFSLAACGSSFEDKVTLLVQGNIDELYLGKFDKDYMELVGTNESECRQNYLDGLEKEAEYFAYYFQIEYLDDDLKAEIVDLYKEIYSYSNYTVGSASKLDDSTCAVKIEISPINIVQLVLDDYEIGMADFFDKYAEVDVEAMTEEEYQAYDREWADAILALFYDNLPDLGYEEAQSIAVQVAQGDDGIWMIADNDMSTIDLLMIYYP